jgi:hypothetical protein
MRCSVPGSNVLRLHAARLKIYLKQTIPHAYMNGGGTASPIAKRCRAMAIFIFNFITVQTSGHNFGPDALTRKQCQARVLAALGRALGVGPRQVRASQVKSERARSVLALAAVGALQLRRSRRDGGTSRCAGTACKRTYRSSSAGWPRFRV